MPIVPFIIDNKDVVGNIAFDVINPSTGTLEHQCSGASIDDVNCIIASAERAFPTWSKTKPHVRRSILLRAGDIFEHRREELMGYMCNEMGGDIKFAQTIYDIGLDLVRDTAGRISSIEGAVPALKEDGTSGIVYKRPYGVVLGIAPWNAPFILGTRAVVIAIAAGNAAILKGSELAPKCFWAIGDVFREAGLPDGVLNVLFHRPQDASNVTAALIAHPAIKKVTFTGSTAVGKIIGALAAKYVKPVLLELGGKASCVVLDDADLDKAAVACTIGSFLNSGQICMSTERIVVQRAVVDAFRPILTAAVEKFYGSTTTPRILVNASAVNRNKDLVSNAVFKGANLLFGDLHNRESSDTRMRPIVVDNVTSEMRIFKTESFGPTVSLIVVDTDEEAIAVANDTEYGLTASVFSEDLRRGLRVAKQIESGAVHINSMTVHDEAALPHGGMKMSGFGRYGGSIGLDQFLRTKSITWQD
ncbi:Aldehyde/histidinol dehydrogenase [Talaromyces proteolyticus]|uniref:Aldehyde/histidinol dehydrogenase n=1 Tax=Talaromyces proteolyticus TaxID=1131652 RepID=A0AAD4Q6K2_9EURO|nr:Aldehyde/histidinol dehydrogenase [Talaromyces proteolyticus]KAH8705791.1 Aldehyde/histidinol dehydrogenase [Talaromyces proteolyticus]